MDENVEPESIRITVSDEMRGMMLAASMSEAEAQQAVTSNDVESLRKRRLLCIASAAILESRGDREGAAELRVDVEEIDAALAVADGPSDLPAENEEEPDWETPPPLDMDDLMERVRIERDPHVKGPYMAWNGHLMAVDHVWDQRRQAWREGSSAHAYCVRGCQACRYGPPPDW